MRHLRGLARTTVTRHRLQLAVSEGPLADRDSVKLDELADHTIVVWGKPGSSGYTDLLVSYCRQAGFEPKIERTQFQGVPPETAVVGTGHVAFVTAPTGAVSGGAARVIALTPPIYAPLIALWPEHGTSAARDAFLASAEALSVAD